MMNADDTRHGIRTVLLDYARSHMANNGLTYHNAQHIHQVQSAFELLYGADALTLEIELAIAWHDFVYVPGAPNGYNEGMSALALRNTIARVNGLHTEAYEQWTSALDVDQVCEIIQATTVFNHTSASYEPSSSAIARVMDCDLSSLAAPHYDFFLQVQDLILIESCGWLALQKQAVPKMRRAQAHFLSQFVADLRPYVYRTVEARVAWEDQARSNINRFVDEHGA